MPALLDLQRAFRDALLDAGAPPPEGIIAGVTGAAPRFEVYRNNVRGNLTGALRLTFPAVERLVGAVFFAVAAETFLCANPPSSPDLYEYGEGFAAFLATWEPAAALPYLADMARLEWVVNHALHAPVVPALTAEALLDLPPAAQAGLRFVPHPTLGLLALSHPARAIWEAVLSEHQAERDTRLAAINATGGGEMLAVLQRGGALVRMPLSAAGFVLASARAEGRTLEAALDATDPEEAAPLLGTFLAQGFFAAAYPVINEEPGR